MLSNLANILSLKEDQSENGFACIALISVVLGGIPVHTEYRCIRYLRFKFLLYRYTGVFDCTTFGTLRCVTQFQTGPFQCCASKIAQCDRGANIS